MQRDRFLYGILVGIGVLIVLALILFFIRQNNIQYEDESTPGGVFQNYILALQQRDYDRAYTYLADGPGKPDISRFRLPFLTYQAGEIVNVAVEVVDVIEDEGSQTAMIQLTLLRTSRGLLTEIYREPQTAQMVLQTDGWKIVSAPYPYWSYDWSIQLTPPPKSSLQNAPALLKAFPSFFELAGRRRG